MVRGMFNSDLQGSPEVDHELGAVQAEVRGAGLGEVSRLAGAAPGDPVLGQNHQDQSSLLGAGVIQLPQGWSGDLYLTLTKS